MTYVWSQSVDVFWCFLTPIATNPKAFRSLGTMSSPRRLQVKIIDMARRRKENKSMGFFVCQSWLRKMNETAYTSDLADACLQCQLHFRDLQKEPGLSKTAKCLGASKTAPQAQPELGAQDSKHRPDKVSCNSVYFNSIWCDLNQYTYYHTVVSLLVLYWYEDVLCPPRWLQIRRAQTRGIRKRPRKAHVFCRSKGKMFWKGPGLHSPKWATDTERSSKSQ